MRYKIFLIIILSALTCEASADCQLLATVTDNFNFGKLVIPIGTNVGSTLVTQEHPAASAYALVKASFWSKCTLEFSSESSSWNGNDEILQSKIPGIGFKVETNNIPHISRPGNKFELRRTQEFFHKGSKMSLIKIGEITPGDYSFIAHAIVDPIDDKVNQAVNIYAYLELHNPSCELENNSKNQNVHLGTVNTVDLRRNGGLSSEIPFTLKLNCPKSAPSQAKVTFNGQESADPSLLALNPTSGGAEGLAVRINNSDGTKIELGSPSLPITNLSEGTNELKFTAQYQVLAGQTVKPGIANATASFTVAYD